jgi:hypothetical protein
MFPARTRLRPLDDRLPQTELVLGLAVGATARAYPLAMLHRRGAVVNDSIDGRAVVILARPGSWLTAAFFRDVDGRPLEFVAGTDHDLEDIETRSSWDLTGTARKGPLVGRELKPAVSWIAKWYGWSAEHLATEIFEG